MNCLADETSPYLLQHKNNPVDWQPWSAGVLARARRENKPILLSVGYAACHWCHVMAHESFEDPDIAQVMNDLYINIKVDREERPDLDVIYQTALALLGEQGGWPLTMFLTPDGEPFWGGTYFPSTARYGRPAFPDILKGVADTYHTQTEKVLQNVGAIRDAMNQLACPKPGQGLTMGLLDETAVAVDSIIDRVHGGTAGAPKFPQPALFRFLWRASRRNDHARFGEAVRITLDRICQGGIYDHLGGGFSRYSTDETWLAPHFEKMLYDNAQLIELLGEAWQVSHSPLYATRIEETVRWLLREMKVEDGAGFAFASAYDADSEGEEGKFYVWPKDEIDSVLGESSQFFKKAYDVTARGNWEGKNILNRSQVPALGDRAHEDALRDCREKLLAVRNRRPWPQWDHKVLADWNGLMIAALAKASAVFRRPQWLAVAETVFAFVCRNMTGNGRLFHAWAKGRARHSAILDDYANLCRAALFLFEVSGRRTYLNQAEAWVALVNRRYWDQGGGGYFLTADDATDVILRSKTVADNAVPSGNGTMAEVLARLFHLTGNPEYRKRADDLIAVFSGGEPRHLTNQPTLLGGYELLENAVQVVIVKPVDDEGGAARLVDAAFGAGNGNLVLQHLGADDALPPGHPAHGKGPVDGKPAAYVCVGATCGLALTDADALRRTLASL